VFLTVQSKTKTLEDVTDFVNINIKERLQSIPGVRLVESYAGRKRAMRLRMDPVKLAAYGLTPLADIKKLCSVKMWICQVAGSKARKYRSDAADAGTVGNRG
jgi:multidrug efflux pump subunit AcrB